MKKLLLVGALFMGVSTMFAQTRQNVLQPASPAAKAQLMQVDRQGLTENLTKNLLCVDTIRYPQAKEQIVGADNMYEMSIWQIDNEAISQVFEVTGAGLSVLGIEFFGYNDAVGSITMRASLYNVDAQNRPTSQLATGTVIVTDVANYYYVNFGSPVAVSNKYAVVIECVSANAIFNSLVSDLLPSQAHDEDLTRYRSAYYPNSANQYVSIPVLTNDATNFPGNGTTIPAGPYNFEPMVAPRVQYNITSTASVTPDPACVNQTLNAVGTSGPSNILSSRFYNYQKFQQYFMGAVADSTFAWDFDDATAIVWGTPTTTHAYATNGTYDATYYVLGGFWNSCADFATDQVTINPLPAVNAGMDATICNGSSTALAATGATTFTWSPGTALSSTTIANPTAAPTSTQTYTVTGTDAAGCVNTDQVIVNVNNVTDATFNYPSNTFCTGSGNPIPTAANTGTYSSTAGLVFVNTTTGEINLAASTNGSYVVTHTTTGLCPDVETQSITITTAPDANFSYANAAYCQNGSNPLPSFGAGASAGVFSSSAGLNFVNANTGQINLATSTPGSYTITNTIAASGSCPQATGTFGITINAQPTVNAGNDQTICTGTQVTLSGAGADTYSWDNSVINATPFTPAVGSVSYTVTGTTTATGCTNTDQVVVTVNALPTVNAGIDQTICQGSSVTLTGSGASTHTWNNGVTNGAPFTPAVGVTTYTVTGTSAAGCVNTDDVVVTVNATPVVNAGADQTICIEDGAITLSAGTPTGGTYAGTGVTGTQFNPATSGVGTFNISYSVTASGCTGDDEVAITVEQCMSVEELDINISIAPNPAKESITISQDGANDLSYTLLSEDGKVIVATTKLSASTQTINVSQLAAGMYFLHFTNNDGQIVKKIIIE